MVHDKTRRIAPEIVLEHYSDAADQLSGAAFQLSDAVDTLRRIHAQGGIKVDCPDHKELGEIIAQLNALLPKIRNNRVRVHKSLLCGSH